MLIKFNRIEIRTEIKTLMSSIKFEK